MKGTIGLITTIMQNSDIKLLITLKTSNASLIHLKGPLCCHYSGFAHVFTKSLHTAVHLFCFIAVIKSIRSINYRKKMQSSSFAFQSLCSVLQGKAEIPTNAILVHSVPNLTEKLLPNRRNVKHGLKESRGIAF